jgi:hypothetical protein
MDISVYGYHGTSRVRAKSIIENGFRLSDRGYDWLGPGVYFWQDAPQRALEWAMKYHPDDPVVIRSSILFEEGKTMDLLDTRWFPSLSERYADYVASFLESELRIPEQDPNQSKKHYLDHSFLDYISLIINRCSPGRISVIRAAFTEGNPIYLNSAIHDLSHVQISVRDRKYIQNSVIL